MNDVPRFYNLSSSETLKFWELLKENNSETNINNFIESICLEDFIKIVYKLLETSNPKEIKIAEDVIYLYCHIKKCSEEIRKFLIDACDYRWFYLVKKREEEKKNNEKIYVNKIVENFNDIFPNYTFVGTEYIVEKIGRIDIFAKENETLSPVIIECKVKNHNPTKQLLACGSYFHNPILIGITEKRLLKKSQHDKILYLTYKDFGIGGICDE